MITNVFFVLLISISLSNCTDLMIKDNKHYGPFILTSLKVEPCRGPKRVDLVELSCKVIQVNDNAKGIFNVTFMEPSKVDEVKILVSSVKGGERKTMYNSRVADPCKHYFVEQILENNLHAKNCEVQKGNYVFEIDLTETARNFFGGSFFYGDFMFKVVSMSKKGNLGCVMVKETFVKKE